MRRRPAHLRRARRARDPPRARACAAAGVGPGDHVGLYLRNSRRAPRGDARLLQAARGPDQRQLPLRRRRARVPAATTPTSSRSFHDADTVARRRRGSRSALRARRSIDGVRRRTSALAYEARRRGRRRATSARARPTTTTCSTPAARPARPKGVVWRQEDIFFAALGGGNPGGPPIDRARGDRARRCSTTRAQRLRPVPAARRPGARRSSSRSRSVR